MLAGQSGGALNLEPLLSLRRPYLQTGQPDMPCKSILLFGLQVCFMIFMIFFSCFNHVDRCSADD